MKQLLSEGVQSIDIDGRRLRAAGPSGQGRGFKGDGSNIPWLIDDLQKQSPERFRGWIDHLRGALPDLENIRTVLRDDDRHRYLMIRYQQGFEVPSWMVSDGTLRLLALTLPAYLADFRGVCLVEEPENGIHPGAIEAMFQSLSSNLRRSDFAGHPFARHPEHRSTRVGPLLRQKRRRGRGHRFGRSPPDAPRLERRDQSRRPLRLGGSRLMKNLVVLVADKDTKQALIGIFSRHDSLKIQRVQFDIYVHSNRDPGCYREHSTFLREFIKHYGHALVIFDREGCGDDRREREFLEKQVEDGLAANGWEGRSAAIVIDPELEIWVWADSPHVANALGWSDLEELKRFLRDQKLLDAESIKPSDPKSAVEAALRKKKIPRS